MIKYVSRYQISEEADSLIVNKNLAVRRDSYNEYNYIKLINKNTEKSNLYTIASMENSIPLIIENSFHIYTVTQIYRLFKYAKVLTGVKIGKKNYFITRGLITDTNLNAMLAVMAKKDKDIMYPNEYEISDLIVFVTRAAFMFRDKKNGINTLLHPVLKIIKEIATNCINGGIETRIMDDFHCFTVPDITAHDAGMKIDPQIFEKIDLTI